MSQISTKFINGLLIEHRNLTLDDDQTWSFMVHATIVHSLQPTMDKFFIKNNWTIFDYNLQIGEKLYDMRIISVKLENVTQLNYLLKFINISQLSFPWKDNLTLFIELEQYSVLEEFIRKYDLQTDILKIEEQIGITANDVLIKVVTFKFSGKDKDVIIHNYQNHLMDTLSYQKLNQYYFMSYIFPWQQLFMAKFSNTRLENDFCRTFSILLRHLGTLKHNSDLNIFDLISLRLALCEFSFSPEISCIKTEIDFMVKRELTKIVTNNHLNFDQYLVSINYEQNNVLVSYMIYVFQMYFKTFNIGTGFSTFAREFQNPKVRTTIVLVKEVNILDIIEAKTNVKFDIDCRAYDKMSLSLFVQLVNFSNVAVIRLDTNYKWFSNHCNPIRSMSTAPSMVEVQFIGNNTDNFVEDFVSSFKTVTFPETKNIVLVIQSSLSDYLIFDNIKTYGIEFLHIKIDTHMLNGLNRCNLESIKHLKFRNCTFENLTVNWKLLFNLHKYFNLLPITIQEDEGTLLTLFEYISNVLTTSKSKDFRFHNRPLSIQFLHGTVILLNEIKFSIDDQNSKLEIRINDQVIDVFDWKFGLMPDDKLDYDFYQ